MAAGKQAHLCEAHGHQTAISRFSRYQWKPACRTGRGRCFAWGGLEPNELRIEKSAEAIVPEGNKPR
jgi:hypothetical protein